MKHQLLITSLFLLSLGSFAQDKPFEYKGRSMPVIKKEKLAQARYLSDIMPGFSRHFVIPYKESVLFQQQIRLLPSKDVYGQDQDNYDEVIDLLASEITVKSKGVLQTVKSSTDSLTSEQRVLLASADMGSNIFILVRYRFRQLSTAVKEIGGEVKRGDFTVTLVPEKEAVYPGGNKELSAYINSTVFAKLDQRSVNRMMKGIATFTIAEDGKVEDVKIFRSADDAALDKLLLQAIVQMPLWKPAENTKGMKIRQEFTLALGQGGEGC